MWRVCGAHLCAIAPGQHNFFSKRCRSGDKPLTAESDLIGPEIWILDFTIQRQTSYRLTLASNYANWRTQVIQCLWPLLEAVDRQMVVQSNPFIRVWTWQTRLVDRGLSPDFWSAKFGLRLFLKILPAFVRFSRVLAIVLCEFSNQLIENNGFHEETDLFCQSYDSKLVLVCYHSSLFHSWHALFSF